MIWDLDVKRLSNMYGRTTTKHKHTLRCENTLTQWSNTVCTHANSDWNPSVTLSVIDDTPRERERERLH